MPSIPLYHYTPSGAGSPGVRADPHMLDAQFQAGKNLGQAVAGVADATAEINSKIQHAQSYKQVATVDMAMQEEWDDFQNNLNPATDETKWVQDWQKKLDARVAKVSPKDAAPLARQEMELRTKSFRVRSSGDVGQQAKAAGVEKAKTVGLTRTDQLWRNGEPEAAEANLHDMAKLGLILPEQIPGLVQKGTARMEIQQATHLIAGDPIAATDALEEKTPSGQWKNFKHLDEDDRLTLLNHARTQTTAIQSGNFQDLIDGLNNNVAKRPEQLQAMVDQKLITPKQMKSYTAAYNHGKFVTDPANVGQLFTDISNYDPLKDSDQTQRAKLLGRIATSGYPTNIQSEANQLLGKKTDPNNLLNTAVAKDAFEGIDRRFNLGIYGKYETRVIIPTGPMAGQWTTTVDKGIFEKAMVTKRRVEDATRKFLEENPKATAEQVNKFVSDVQLGDTVKSGRQAVLSGLGMPTAQPRSEEDAKAKKARLDAILTK